MKALFFMGNLVGMFWVGIIIIIIFCPNSTFVYLLAYACVHASIVFMGNLVEMKIFCFIYVMG